MAIDANRDSLKGLTAAVEEVATVIVGAGSKGLSSEQREFFLEMKRDLL